MCSKKFPINLPEFKSTVGLCDGLKEGALVGNIYSPG